MPTYWADVQVPFVAVLSFRVGRADETLVTGGLTHLVEHIAIPIDELHGLDVNGSVGPTTTVFWASGEPESALEFIESVAASLSSLPLERFETERSILQTEAAGGGTGTVGHAFMLRYGARGYGLVGHDQYGLNHLTADHVAAWAAERFTRENAVLWLTDKPPRDLRLPLPSGGRRIPAPDPAPISEVEFPAVYDRADAIALTCVAPRSTALVAAAAIAHRRLRRRLRYEEGRSYSVDALYDPLTASLAHLMFTADLLSTHAEPVRDGLIETLTELARVGPTKDELDREVVQAGRDLADRHNTGSLHFMATNELLEAPLLDPSDLVREWEALAPSDVAAALTNALESALLIVPFDTGGEVPGFAHYPVSSTKTVSGKRYFTGRLRRKKDSQLVAGHEGVRFVFGEESSTVLFDECEALVRRGDGTRALWSTDGFFVYIDPAVWRHGHELAELVDERVPEDRWVPMDPEHDARLETVARASSEGKLKRGWMTSSELDLLPHVLKHDEELLLASRADRGWKAGVLAVTNRRLLFLFLDELVLELPIGSIEDVSTKGWRWINGQKLIVRTGDVTYKFSEIKKELLERFAELLRPATPQR